MCRWGCAYPYLGARMDARTCMHTHTCECRCAYRHVCVRARECANMGVQSWVCTWEWACLQVGVCTHTYPFVFPIHVCVDAQVCVCLHACAPRRAPRQACARACVCADAGARGRACTDTSAWVATGTRVCAGVSQTRGCVHTRANSRGAAPPPPLPAPTTTTTSAVPAAKNIPHGCLQPSPRQREDGERGLGGWGGCGPPQHPPNLQAREPCVAPGAG